MYGSTHSPTPPRLRPNHDLNPFRSILCNGSYKAEGKAPDTPVGRRPPSISGQRNIDDFGFLAHPNLPGSRAQKTGLASKSFLTPMVAKMALKVGQSALTWRSASERPTLKAASAPEWAGAVLGPAMAPEQGQPKGEFGISTEHGMHCNSSLAPCSSSWAATMSTTSTGWMPRT